ncbi:hypothetical protein NC661_13385 [Aquibacillus koreensis]|uniref:Uncharacterized protein n=1 Tax=Aquibacillus koreensis TaxID=279446 RepID=A0A9X3WM80_9BACI|nr:hypothetical protein [Aquibacillus koreensis]MCT2536286.1 hypothetical protein [Aquibacillus koreensis]MDC3421363.1 hypothetical protein [Aquibacillus koreensis]
MRSEHKKDNSTLKKSEASNHISIPITKSMMDFMLKYKTPKGIDALHVILHNGFIELSGIATKKLVKIPFNIKLKPIKTEHRKIYFEILELKPVNLKWLNKLIFQKPPILSYNDVVIMDLNGIKRLRTLPYGTISDLEVKENFIWCHVDLK